MKHIIPIAAAEAADKEPKKAVLVTGASRGIGYSIAKAFVKEGYAVYGLARHVSESLALEAKEQGFLLLEADACDEKAMEAIVSHINHHHKAVHILVNNAGIACYRLLQEMSLSEWDQVMSSNLKSAFVASKAVIPGMLSLSEAERRACSILNISSIWGLGGASMEAAYSASKGGLNALTKSLAKELGPSGIRVNALVLGAMETSMNDHLTEEDKASFAENIALGRFGTPEEAAQCALFLSSEKASYVTGALLEVTGGY